MTNNLERKSCIFSAAASAVCFILMLVIFAFVKFEPSVKYKTIQIQLASPSAVVKKTEPQKKTVSAVKENTAPKKETAPQKDAAPKKENAVKKENTPKPSAVQKKSAEVSTKKVAPAPVKKQEVSEPKIRKSVEELMAEQNAGQTKKAQWDESMFDDSAEWESSSSSSSQSSSADTLSSSLEGTAASASSGASDSVSATSRKDRSSSVSDSTASALSDIADTEYSMSVSDSAKSTTSMQSSKTDGRVSIMLANGKMRELISPKNPVLDISPENAMLVDSSRTVRITFTVLADGSVPLGEIEIRPSSLLPPKIQDEIKNQLRFWIFSSDPSGTSGRASFDYTLEIR